jgi:hypothetical protein
MYNNAYHERLHYYLPLSIKYLYINFYYKIQKDLENILHLQDFPMIMR